MKKEEAKVTIELERILSHQEEQRSAVRLLEDLDAAIRVQEEIISSVQVDHSRLPELITKREDLLADVAIGAANEGEVADLDAEIALEKEREQLHADETAGKVPGARQAIAGLLRKKEAVAAELASLRDAKKTDIASLLRAETERLGAEYLAAAQALTEKFKILCAYGRLLSNHAPSSRSVSPHWDLDIPLFSLVDSHNGYGCKIRHGRLPVPSESEIAETIKEERARIAELGVEW